MLREYVPYSYGEQFDSHGAKVRESIEINSQWAGVVVYNNEEGAFHATSTCHIIATPTRHLTPMNLLHSLLVDSTHTKGLPTIAI